LLIISEKHNGRKNVSFFCAGFIEVTSDPRSGTHVVLHFITKKLNSVALVRLPLVGQFGATF
jgi:hypothetical protein